MPFQYQPSESRSALTIGDILRERGLMQARAAEQAGAIQARAAEQSGQAWAGAVQNIGQTVAAIPGQVQQQKRTAQQDEATGLALDEHKQAAASRAAFMKVIKDTPQIDEDGTSLFDVASISKQLAAAGADPNLATHLNDLNHGFRAEKAAKLSLVKLGAEKVMAAGNDPTLAGVFLDQLEKNGTVPPAVVAQYREFINADPGNVAKLTAYLAPQKMENAAPGSVSKNPLTGQIVPGSEVADPKAAETARHNAAMEAIQAGTGDRAAAAAAEAARHNKAMEGLGAQKNANAAAAKNDVTDLSPAGIDIAALNYRKTGNLPPLGMGDKTTRKEIINRSATLTPEDIARIESGGTDIAGNKASYKADADSLAAMQKQRDAIGAFEQTAMKNIDVFLASAAKIADTGSPLLNMSARLVTGKMLGSPDQAAYEAARQVAINEIAKITSNPTLSGTLSDSARHEVDAFNPQNATLKQTIAVMRLLKTDMKNRTSSLDDALAATKARISKGGGAPPAAPGTIRARDPQGNLHEAPAGTVLPAGWKLER